MSEFNEPQLDAKFKGGKLDSLSPESADEFYSLLKNWDKLDDPVEELNKWCVHYYGRKHVPINFALDLWQKKVEDRDEIWPFVEKELSAYRKKLAEHGASAETIADIESRLKSSDK